MAGQGEKEHEGEPEGEPEASASSAAGGAAALREETRRLLERAAELVEERSHWTKRAFARDRHSHPVSASSERAERFCAGGALLRAASEQFGITFDTGARLALTPDGVIVTEIEEIGLPPLTATYQLLAHAFEWIILRPVGIRIRVQRSDDGFVPTIVLPAADETGAIEEETSWSALVHTFNDHARHEWVLDAFTLAQSFTTARSRPTSEDEGQAS